MIDYFPKLIELDALSPEHEPTIQIVRPGEYNRLNHVKTASEALDFIKQVKPIPGKTVILVLAMTAGEFYGPNRNGDAWPERPIRSGKIDIPEEATLPKHHKTFETNANVFRHHVNKDPNRRIGEVIKSFYNWPMHRVELLLALDNSSASDIVHRIERDEFPAVSMGCKVKHDICSLPSCGNKAPSRAQYCDHAKYHLGELLPNGKRIFVWNPYPKFFDISMVRRPADKHGFMMKKVAETLPEIRSSAIMGEYVDTMQRKSAALGKLSVIDKVLKGIPVAAKEDDGDVHAIRDFGQKVAIPAAQDMPELDDGVIRYLIKFRPAEVLATLSSMGIFLTTPEFIKFFAWKMDPSLEIPDGVLDRAVAVQGHVFRMLAQNPDLLDEVGNTGFLDASQEDVNPALAEKVSSLLEKRSQFKEYLYRHMMPESFKPHPTRGKWDLVTVRDPQTGRVYQTTRLARERAADAATEDRFRDIAGGGALLAGGAGLLMSRGLRFLAPLGLIPGAVMAGRGTRGYPSVVGSTGERVYTGYPHPGWRQQRGLLEGDFQGTELVEKRSSFDELDLMDATVRIALDNVHRPNAKMAHLDTRSLDQDVTSFDEAASKLGSLICP